MALRQADVVVVCFDATKQSTLDSVRASWYPRIQRLNPDVPVIMACCKADKLSEEREVAMLREVRPLRKPALVILGSLSPAV
jgi:Ras family protein T1